MIHVVSTMDYVLMPVFTGMNKSIHKKKYQVSVAVTPPNLRTKKVEEWVLMCVNIEWKYHLLYICSIKDFKRRKFATLYF